jgi:YspA, cpYpsA-related SLOG family
MKVIIAGSRGITDFATVCDAVQRSGFPITRVISGMAKGVDTLAVRFATDNGLPCDRYPADWTKWGRGAGYKRNVEMARNADALIALWDGQSRGTRHMIQVAKARGLQVFVALPQQLHPQLHDVCCIFEKTV